MFQDSPSNGVHSRSHRLGRSILPLASTSHFFCNLVFMAPAASGVLSASTNFGLSCQVSGILQCEVVPDPCSLPCSAKCILSLLSSLKNKRPGPQPAGLQSGDERPVLKSVRVKPVNIQAQANRLPLGRTALLINHASGKWVVCTWGPLAVTKPL